MLAESRLDTLNRMEVAVFPQQQRAKLCPQRGRVAALVEVAADRVAGGVYLLLLIQQARQRRQRRGCAVRAGSGREPGSGNVEKTVEIDAHGGVEDAPQQKQVVIR